MIEFLKKIWAWVVSIPQDKLLHDYAGALICLYTFALVKIFVPYWPSLVIANVVALCGLVGKEIYDHFHPEEHSTECKDILFGMFGMAKVDVALLLLASVLA